jgi:hypothetical protein
VIRWHFWTLSRTLLAGRPPPCLGLIRHSVKRTKGRFGVGIVTLVLRLALHMVVGLVEKPNQPVDLVPGFLAKGPDGLKGLFRVTGVLY